MRISIDAELCVASGNCVSVASEIFDQNQDDGRVVLLVVEVPAGMEARVRKAAQLCPVGAIRLLKDPD